MTKKKSPYLKKLPPLSAECEEEVERILMRINALYHQYHVLPKSQNYVN